MSNTRKRASWSGQLAFVLAAAASAIGLGNLWRFPYLAAQYGGGTFIVIYLCLVVTLGFTLMLSEIAIGRKTQQSQLTAYSQLHRGWGFIGFLGTVVPLLIVPYYCVIGGWVLKYLADFLMGAGAAAAADGYFTGFITGFGSPIFWFLVFLAATVLVVYKGVDKGIEKLSRILMPVLLLLIIGISCFSLTLAHTDAAGVTRTGLEGMRVYVIPDFSGMTLGRFLVVLMDALGQLFYSVSVAMGIMITYGSYVRKETNLVRAVNQIEIFDTLVAFLAGLMIVPAVYTFMGTEGMSAGPSLMFISLPKIFEAMGAVGAVVGTVFFVMVAFAALTSSVSIMEAVVSCVQDRLHAGRTKATLGVGVMALVIGLVVCLGYNALYFELKLPNGAVGQLLDVMDYISNSFLMPAISLLTCVFVGWVVGPQLIIEEMERTDDRFTRKKLYRFMIRYAAPIIMAVLFLQSTGLLSIFFH